MVASRMFHGVPYAHPCGSGEVHFLSSSDNDNEDDDGSKQRNESKGLPGHREGCTMVSARLGLASGAH